MRLLSLFTFTLTALPYYAYSYCVYNKHSDNTMLHARQYKWNGDTGGWRSFEQDISAGSKACCPYTERTCNQNLSVDSILKLWIERHAPGARGVSHFSVTLPAGGWIVVDGDLEHHTVAVKWPNGQDYLSTRIEYGAKWHAELNGTRTANVEEQQHQLQNTSQPHLLPNKTETH